MGEEISGDSGRTHKHGWLLVLLDGAQEGFGLNSEMQHQELEPSFSVFYQRIREETC